MPDPDASCPDCRHDGTAWSPCRRHDPLRLLAIAAADEQHRKFPATAIGAVADPRDAGQDILILPVDLYPEVRRRLDGAEDLEALVVQLAVAVGTDELQRLNLAARRLLERLRSPTGST